jgi:hypothetical protein
MVDNHRGADGARAHHKDGDAPSQGAPGFLDDTHGQVHLDKIWADMDPHTMNALLGVDFLHGEGGFQDDLPLDTDLQLSPGPYTKYDNMKKEEDVRTKCVTNGRDDGQGGSHAGKRKEKDEDVAAEVQAAGGRDNPTKKYNSSKDAAVAKADRERKRRERLNKCFDELAQTCAGEFAAGVSQALCKTDRMSIILDAIRVVKALRVEVNQLRQLNKFMEERVGQLERGRAQDLYSQSQGIALAGSLHVGNMHGALSHGNLYGEAGPSGARGYAGYRGQGEPETLGVRQQEGVPYDISQKLSGGIHGQQDGYGRGGAPIGRYLPPPNLSEDEKLRPPAA